MLLAGAMMPMVSPLWSAGGLVRGFWATDSMGSPILNEKLTPADDLRRTTQEHFPLPAHTLCAARSMHLHRRVRPSGMDRRHRGRRGACTGRLGFSYAAFKKPHFDVVFISDRNHLNV